MLQENSSALLMARLEQLVQRASLHSKPVLTIEEAAAYTGRSTSNLYKLTSKGVIPHSKPYGSRIYFDREALETWMLSNPIKTASEIESEAATRAAIQPLFARTPRQRYRQ